MLPAVFNDTALARRTGSPINRLFDQFFNDDDFLLPMKVGSWRTGPLALWEDENNVHVEADMPGLKQEDLEVTVHGSELMIRGERRSEQKKNGYDTRSYGRFEQRITLPMEVDADRVDARLIDGVLKLSFPKSEAAKPKRIAIKPE